MSDETREPPEEPGVLERIADRVEDAVESAGRRLRRGVENAGEAAARELDEIEDAVERALRRHHREHEHHHQGPAPATSVHVTVDCRCSSCAPCPPGGGTTGGTGTGGRPTHQTGTVDPNPGTAADPGGVVGIVGRPPDVWPGPRTKLYLPFLFIRTAPGDTAVRPVAGVFWESPDIFVMPGVAPSAAPALPPQLGGVAQAGADNTLYAHVWNLGQAPAFDALVEFYWFNPALGFSGDQAHLVGATWVDLAPRSAAGSHKVVKCPMSWRAGFVNGGHECLVVRISQPVTDPLSGPPWDARSNRHVAQRNIHVMSAAEAAAKPTLGIAVGPLFGGAAQVAVARADTATMPWLHLVTMSRTAGFGNAGATGDVGLTAPAPAGAPLPNLGGVPDPRGAGLIGDAHGVAADGQQVGFHATDGDPGAGNAHVYRVTGTQDGSTFGGYTVVVLGQH